jgi:excisionase family DNA binding protein
VLSTSEAAAELGVSERTLRRYITSGLIVYRQLPGGHYRIPREAIDEFWREHSTSPRRTARRQRLAARHSHPRAARATTATESSRRARLSAASAPRSYEVPPAHRVGVIARNPPSAEQN